MTALNKISMLFTKLLHIEVIDSASGGAVLPAEEVFKEQSKEFFTNPAVHLDALQAEQFRVQMVLRSGCPGMGMLQEAHLERYIDLLSAFKLAFRKQDNTERPTAVLTRSQSDKHMKYTLETFDYAGNPLHCASYTFNL